MDKKSQLFLAFGLGALVGAAAVALYSTDEGKALVKRAKEQLDDLGDDLTKAFKEYESTIADFVNGKESAGNRQA